MSPVDNPPRQQCDVHQVVCATVSSLEKCAACVGPVAAFKWQGYQCKTCLNVWHKICLRRTKTDFVHVSEVQFDDGSVDEQLPGNGPPQNISEDDTGQSDADFVPDSAEESEDDIPVISPAKKFKKTFAELVNDLIGTDESTSDRPGSSKDLLPPEDPDSPPPRPNLSEEVSGAEHQVEETTAATLSSKNSCFICGKSVRKMARHLQTHSSNLEVSHAFSFPPHSKERKKVLDMLRNRGNFQHNTEVLQTGKGELKIKRKPDGDPVREKFIHCIYCQGMFVRKHLWRHVKRCARKPEDEEQRPGRRRVLGTAASLESASQQQVSTGVWKLLTAMNQDEVASVVRNDLTIVQFAQSLVNKHGQDATKNEYMRQKLREVGRLLLCLQKDFSVANMEDAVKPPNFPKVLNAVKKVSGYQEQNNTYSTPSLALKLGHTLHKIADIVHCRALVAEDEALMKSTDMFKKLYTSKWSEVISHGALTTLSDAKYNKPSTLPFTEDVKLLHGYLERNVSTGVSKLKEVASCQHYSALAQILLAQIIVFNRRRAGEVSKMLVESFESRDDHELHEDVALGLSKLEQRLCSYFSRVEIKGKRGRKVAVLLTPKMVDGLSLLVSKRVECHVCASNAFLFARPKAMSHYRGQDALRVCANLCGAKHPEHLRSTQLRKHVATLSQVLNLKHNELDQVADFLGHDIRVHRDFYRLPVPTTQLAKISKLLLTLEKGTLSKIQGKSLDDIEIQDELDTSDTEEMDGGSDSGDEAEVSGSGSSTSKCMDAAPECSATEQVGDTEDFNEALAPVTSSVQGPTPVCGEPDSAAEPDSAQTRSRRVKKKPWSKTEVAAVMRHFRKHIEAGKLAGKDECSQCKLAEAPLLDHRSVQNIRDFVRNRGVTAKRQAKKK
ncbi:uncharacterized protein LOC128750869 [Synchiropus splendidus]|uniref:uncharacterized protein LOC128750869 n=1 Tax=Synchiropus splendidus TaxID=270530 RepID=UPI00237E9FAF|nr:uncharacterized protein LOC128750869 [Synchiropus splendidus]